jgi:hypothetical protein
MAFPGKPRQGLPVYSKPYHPKTSFLFFGGDAWSVSNASSNRSTIVGLQCRRLAPPKNEKELGFRACFYN